ncbi:MAG: hypothetical protein Q4A00_06515 [Flavobacteriaceae bacterium]|nr:hypothetical protein [Flavobacteriaceae bacterium]
MSVGTHPTSVGTFPRDVGGLPQDVGTHPTDVGNNPRDVGNVPRIGVHFYSIFISIQLFDVFYPTNYFPNIMKIYRFLFEIYEFKNILSLNIKKDEAI